ncbi:neural cell adhesion molecule 1 isoform X1 [Poecilia formosa]|uniref:neural cell adhesion molecule 1-like isoform X1 n=1 Tax=Poecilia formosa TaxID=48698 RepID=UPI0004447A08|nr:PREDICTED: neural cell adhesion molecule 1-like isoform X1 [Poecilia formosa]XP_007552806.1 PREDICTED: neural cell adhesion molecule 1-like isoform X1 [Poecilia formosa]XP_016528804.1 PREDICTED: neural cell adhesion molecule 1-like isoform X1 [Poecilia formosa]
MSFHQERMLNQLAIISLLLPLVHSAGQTIKLEIILSKQDFQVGEEMLLVCKATKEGEMTWHKGGEEIDDEDIVSKLDYTTSKLLIKKASLSDGGTYTCKFESDDGHKADAQSVIYVYEGPSFHGTTTYHEFLEGADGMVPCLVTGRPAVDITWLKDGELIPSTPGVRVRKMSDNTLHIEKVKRSDAGTYICQAQIRGRAIYKQLPVSVVANAPPTVHIREEVKKVIAGPETNVSLLCLVDGLPKPNITWTLPIEADPSRHVFNSDHSQLTIQSVVRDDFGEYVCTAKNKIAENSATFMLHVFEPPEVFISEDQHSVNVGERVSVSCNVTGHPQPELHWINKQNGEELDSTSRIKAVDGVLEIEEVMPSDGGRYSCMAVGISGNASRDVVIQTQPGPPHYLTVTPGPTSVLFTLKTFPINGGAPIKSFVLQWRKSATDKWEETVVAASNILAITNLKPYTKYTVRMAAMNDVGQGQFSMENTVRTEGKQGEPDSPALTTSQAVVEGNSFSVPLQQIENGGSPLLYFDVQYEQDTEESERKTLRLPSDANIVSLKDLSFGSDYHLEVRAVNANGSSIPAMFNFTIAEQPVSSRMTKGTVVGIVILIFLLVFLAVDATCCYRNRCGLLMAVAGKLSRWKDPSLKKIEEGDGTTNGDVTLKGLSKPRGSIQQSGVQTVSKDGQLSEVTCDKAPLTKNEKLHPTANL